MALIDRVKFDGPPGSLVWKFPNEELSWGAQVIVNQSQEALFFKGGKATDLLGPGTHQLDTANIPLLRGLIGAAFGGKTPFAAEIWFVNRAAQLDGKWGTKTPIPLLDPKFNVPLPVRAFGRYGVRVSDSRKLLTGLVGTLPSFTMESLGEHFRGLVMMKVKDYLAETVMNKKIGYLEITAYLEEISADLKGKLEGDFSAWGLELVNFILESVNVPEEDPVVQRLRKILTDKAEMDILGADYQRKRGLDIMEKAAESGGAGLGAGMGLGMGMGAGAEMGRLAAGALGGGAKKCGKCAADAPPGGKFCSSCGSAL